MLLNHRHVFIGLSAVSSVLCDGPQNPDHDILISHFSDMREDLGHESPFMAKSTTSSSTTTTSSTGPATSTPAGSLPIFLKFFDDLENEDSTSLFTPPLTTTQKPSNKNISPTISPESTTTSITSSTSAPNPVQAALDWLTSASSDGKNAASTSYSVTLPTSPSRTTTTSATTFTDPAKAALDWLTSGPDDKSATSGTTTDSKHSSVVSSIISGLEATHTSAAAANRLRVGFW